MYAVFTAVLSNDFTLHAFCQLHDVPAAAPGCRFYKKIKQWRGSGANNTWSWVRSSRYSFISIAATYH